MGISKFVSSLFCFFIFSITMVFSQERQWVEGFDKIVFHYNANKTSAVRDFRGTAPGYMTAGWWAHGQMKEPNRLSWETAPVPVRMATTFAFIGASAVLPSEFSRGPQVKLMVNGHYALTFAIGFTRDFTWKEGEYELKYRSKRVEYPYFGSHRQLELNGNSGIYELSVPENIIQAGNPVLLQLEILPFEGWNGGWFMVKERRDVLKQSMESLEGEIDALQRDMAVINQQTHILATQLYSKMLGTDRFEHTVIYENGFRHLHPADIIRLKNGDLLIMTREASEHYASDGDIVMLRSKDGGKTWGDRQVIGAESSDERQGCAVQMNDGTIVMGVYYNDLYNVDGTYGAYFNWKTQKEEARKTDPGKRYLGAYIITSDDNGYTWSKPQYLDTKDMPFKNLEGPTDAPLELPDGSILMGVIAYSPNGQAGNKASVMLRSEDKGKTWKYISTMADDPEDKLGGFMEPGIVRTKTGRIVTVMRNHGQDHAMYATYSDDDGKTWAPVQKTSMIGHPADLIQLSDGRVMVTYGIRTGPHAKPGGIRACFSSDNGKTWDISAETQLRNDFLNWDTGYPESVELPDGQVLTVYYYNLFGKYFLGGTFWKP